MFKKKKPMATILPKPLQRNCIAKRVLLNRGLLEIMQKVWNLNGCAVK